MTTAEYAHQIKSALLAVSIAGIVGIATGVGGWLGAVAFSLVIGNSFGCAAFVGHELLHGAIVRNHTARTMLGWLAFLPFALSPLLWVAWHNRVHHGHTGVIGVDPDTYPTLEQYKESRLVRWMNRVSPGAGRILGIAAMAVGFTGQSSSMLFRCRKRLGLSQRDANVVIAQTLAGVLVWLALVVALGPLKFIFAFGIPLLIADAIVMMYIFTNHSLSPLTQDENDPLLNSLSVRAPALVEMCHLNFGYHVEHHIFPSMSARHAPLVPDQLVARWPERYQTMPLWAALVQLFVKPTGGLRPGVAQPSLRRRLRARLLRATRPHRGSQSRFLHSRLHVPAGRHLSRHPRPGGPGYRVEPAGQEVRGRSRRHGEGGLGPGPTRRMRVSRHLSRAAGGSHLRALPLVSATPVRRGDRHRPETGSHD
jgi:fatty acid desaturase